MSAAILEYIRNQQYTKKYVRFDRTGTYWQSVRDWNAFVVMIARVLNRRGFTVWKVEGSSRIRCHVDAVAIAADALLALAIIETDYDVVFSEIRRNSAGISLVIGERVTA